MPYRWGWVVEGRLAGMGRPGSGLELAGEMLPYERRFLFWLAGSSTLSAERGQLAERVGVKAPDAYHRDLRMLEMYRKFREIWGILEGYREGFGPGGVPVDRFQPAAEPLEADLQFLREQGIGAIVSLTERPLDAEALGRFRLQTLHLPVPDRTAPSAAQVDRFTGFVDGELRRDCGVAVHCLGGSGRTGTMLACYLVHCGLPATDAIAEVRRKRPGSIEAGEQEAAVAAWEERFR